ncbi:MAG: beta-ketoacyl-[acyl-carrier-protein] synthase family protein [Syntrophus sp. (in: bacteria)]|nr:beta-ketoacyl-[acyl-carrier-protein] synthase family protein [Syntrophus sp. (in: bacteria)]
MHMKRVVITGMGSISPFGKGVDVLIESLKANKSAVAVVPALTEIKGLRTMVAALATNVDPKEIPRKFRRSMSNMSIYATLACHEACAMGRITEAHCSSGRMGVSIGSTVGSPIATHDFYKDFLPDNTVENTRSTFFFQIMNHSCASNVVQVFGIKGRMFAPSSACSTSTQAIGYGYETIAFGKQEMMLCGGADEFHPLSAATFDIFNAASIKYNDRPHMTPRPFDRDRDGVVCAEGSGILLLESLESAVQRGVPVLAEVIGFATVSDPTNIADPDVDSIESCIRKSLLDAGVAPEEIDYVNAHATGTIQGDIAEGNAIKRVFGNRAPVSSLKGHLGHTMAASGALETIATISMMNGNYMIPTLNLDHIDPLCEGLAHIQRLEESHIEVAIKNNFALGGVNTCIVLRRYTHD